MPSNSAPKRVFILGAGFSKPAGFPLATELTDEVLDTLRDHVGPDYGLFEFAEHVRQLHRWISQSETMLALNIEEFYEYASVYAERWNLEQHSMTIGRHDGETPYTHAEDLKTWLSYLDDHLLDVLLKHEGSAELDAIDRFAESLHPGDTVVTFNYDRLVERCLSRRNMPWSFGMEGPQPKIVPVLKMHGSLDWICYARDQRPSPQGVGKLFSKIDVNEEREGRTPTRTGEVEYDFELYHIEDNDLLRNSIRRRALIQQDHAWALAGLGPQKRPSLVPGLGVVWEHARHALAYADKVIIVGFSFSGYDRLAQIEFARVMAGRDERGVLPPQIVVIDPAIRPESDLIKRIQSVFRPIKPISKSHEDFAWGDLD